MVLRTYTDALEWDVTDGDVLAALKTKPRVTGLPNEPFGEAITYSADGKTLLHGLRHGPADDEDAANYILSYTPATKVVAGERRTRGGRTKVGGSSWYSDLSLDDITYLVGGVGVLGVILVGAGIFGIVRSRKKPLPDAGGEERGRNRPEAPGRPDRTTRRRRPTRVRREPPGRQRPRSGVYGANPRRRAAAFTAPRPPAAGTRRCWWRWRSGSRPSRRSAPGRPGPNGQPAGRPGAGGQPAGRPALVLSLLGVLVPVLSLLAALVLSGQPAARPAGGRPGAGGQPARPPGAAGQPAARPGAGQPQAVLARWSAAGRPGAGGQPAGRPASGGQPPAGPAVSRGVPARVADSPGRPAQGGQPARPGQGGGRPDGGRPGQGGGGGRPGGGVYGAPPPPPTGRQGSGGQRPPVRAMHHRVEASSPAAPTQAPEQRQEQHANTNRTPRGGDGRL